MLNVGLPEITVILVVALLLLGPKKLPEFARWAGRALREFRQVTNEFRNAIDLELEKEEFERLQEEFSSTIHPSFIEDALSPDKELHANVDGEDSGEVDHDENDSFLDENSKDEAPNSSGATDSSENHVVEQDTLESGQASSSNELPEITGPPPGTIARNTTDWTDEENHEVIASDISSDETKPDEGSKEDTISHPNEPIG